MPSQSSTYDANDRLNSDTYDANGNTTASNSNSYEYDFENRLTALNNGAVTYVYDGDGKRVSKTIGGVSINYLVDTDNHTGYAQVVEELQNNSNSTRKLTMGLSIVVFSQFWEGTWITRIGSVFTAVNYSPRSTSRFPQNIPGFVHPNRVMDAHPPLKEWSVRWTDILNRKVTPGAFELGAVPTDSKIIESPW